MALVFGCTDDSSGQSSRHCDPGSSIPCTCQDGQRGRMWCLADGSGYGACTCLPSDQGPDLPGDPGTDPSSDPEQGEQDTGGCPCLEDADNDPVGPDTEPEDPLLTDPGEDQADQGVQPDQSDQPDSVEPTKALGEDCTRAGECLTDICISLTVAGVPQAVCVTPCCHEEECPYGFGCLQLGAGRYCLPSRIFPAGYSFTALTGTSCGAGGNHCKSGICDTTNDLCRGTCCTDGDCWAAPCHWSMTGSVLRTFCDPAALLSGEGRTGDLCYSEYDCWAGVCVPNVQTGYYQCADLCCSPGQCPSGTTCGPVAGPTYDSVVRACIPIPVGDSPDGVTCSSDAQCASGLCIEERCRSVCCLDNNCLSPLRCLPRTSPEGVLVPVCVDPEEE